MADMKYTGEQDDSFILAISLWPALCQSACQHQVLKKLQTTKGRKECSNNLNDEKYVAITFLWIYLIVSEVEFLPTPFPANQPIVLFFFKSSLKPLKII